MKKNILLFFSLILFSLPSATAQASFWEFLFPSLKSTRPDPSKTLEAPFADREKINNSANKNEKTTNTIPLDLPHRSPGQLEGWLMQNIPNQLTFISSQTYNCLLYTSDAADE